MKISLVNRHDNDVYTKTVNPVKFTPTLHSEPPRDPAEQYSVEILAITDGGHEVTLTINRIDEDTVRHIQNFFVEDFHGEPS